MIKDIKLRNKITLYKGNIIIVVSHSNISWQIYLLCAIILQCQIISLNIKTNDENTKYTISSSPKGGVVVLTFPKL